MVDCSLACNGILSIGNAPSGWPCHGIEHALSGYYDITHGEGLAIITPKWMKHILNDKTISRFVSYGVNIFGIDKNLPSYEIANLPEGVSYSIVLMNIIVPLIERATVPKPFGTVKEAK